jgi:hypothetical protein
MDSVEKALFERGMVGYPPKPVFMDTLTFETGFEVLPNSVRFRWPDQQIAIISERSQIFSLPDIGLAHLALNCCDSTESVFRLIVAAFAKGEENDNIVVA